MNNTDIKVTNNIFNSFKSCVRRNHFEHVHKLENVTKFTLELPEELPKHPPSRTYGTLTSSDERDSI
jgi:hypothetical protein